MSHGLESSERLLVPVDDATAREVVGAQLHHHPVLRENSDVVLAHLAGDVSEHLVAVARARPGTWRSGELRPRCPSISMTPSFLGMSSAILLAARPGRGLTMVQVVQEWCRHTCDGVPTVDQTSRGVDQGREMLCEPTDGVYARTAVPQRNRAGRRRPGRTTSRGGGRKVRPSSIGRAVLVRLVSPRAARW